MFFSVFRRRRTIRTTLSGQWMRSWCGRKLRGVRFAKFSPTCTTPRSLKGWASAGRRCRTRSASLTLPKLNVFVSCTCKNIPTTNTSHARRPSWVAAPVLRLSVRLLPCQLVRWANRAAIATAASAAASAQRDWPTSGERWRRRKAGRAAPWWHQGLAARCRRRITTTATVRPTRMATPRITGSLRWPKWRRHHRERASRRRWADSAPSTTIASNCVWRSTASSRRAFATAKTCRRPCWLSVITALAAWKRRRQYSRRPKSRPALRLPRFPTRRPV